MKPRIAIKTMLPLLFCAAVAGAQIDTMSPPPVKMGLWQTTATMQMSGMPNMPSGMPGGKPSVTQSCMTADSWQKGLTDMQQSVQRQKAQCTNVKLQHDGSKFTFDETCSTSGYSTTVHVEWNVDDQENMHGNSNMQMSGANMPQGMTMQGTMSSKFLSSDCGGVKPGDTKTVH
ncbi:MAG TPA: DUF3617 family protein [Acidobacteriaceae bacterium]|jgi:hypothetical protein|nr:DUF3617 family protein [Acidobacteriaceae bacterium]